MCLYVGLFISQNASMINLLLSVLQSADVWLHRNHIK